MTLHTAIDLASVSVIGGAVGAGELVVRYKDDPGRALLCLAAGIYVVLNVGAAVGAFGLINAFGWDLGQPSGSSAHRWSQVLIAGFGAMAVLRSSVFLLRINDVDVGVGPSGVIEGLLSAADRGVDRRRGVARSREVQGLVDEVSWEQAQKELPTLCLMLMQNAGASEQENLAKTVRDLSAGDLEDEVRVYVIGLALMNFAGAGVLRGAVTLLSKGEEASGVDGAG